MERYQEANIINHNQINIGYDNMYGRDGFKQTQGYYAQQIQVYGGLSIWKSKNNSIMDTNINMGNK